MGNKTVKVTQWLGYKQGIGCGPPTVRFFPPPFASPSGLVGVLGPLNQPLGGSLFGFHDYLGLAGW